MTEDHDDFAFEPVPGLPEHLPKGESLIWQGSPDWRALAVSAFHVRKIAAYFAIVLAWQLMSASADGATAAVLAEKALKLAAVAGGAVGILTLLAYLYARGTIYTLTTKRIVIRSGLALPVTVNLPLSLIETVAVTRRKDGNGSVALTIVKPNRIAFLALWPNVRPLHFNDPKPMLRCVAEADRVADRLAKALRAETGLADVRSTVRTPSNATDAPAMPAGRSVAA